MGGSTVVIAKPTDPGFMTYTQKTTGRKFTACVCVGAWLPVFEDYCLMRKHIKYSLDIIQITGGDPNSANTHALGAAIDTEQVGSLFIADARACGATASWSRYPPAFSNDHSHLVLNGCPHDKWCHYQIVAQKDGYNGLGYLGRQGLDPYPDPPVYRTWQQGRTFMLAEIKKYEDSLMATIDDDDVERIANRTAQKVWDFLLENRLTKVKYRAGAYLEGGAIWSQGAQTAAQKALALDTAQMAALVTLKDNPNVTVEQMTTIINEAVKHNLSDQVTGTVTVDFGKTE